jgi:tetratricopeptide (TPR) repeat protein
MTIQEQDNIKAFVDGTMTASLKAEFEAQLAQSEALQIEVGRYRRLDILLQYSHLIDAQKQLRQVMDAVPITPGYGPFASHFPTPAPVIFRFWRWILGILVVLLLLSGLWGYRQYSHQQALKKLSETHLTPLDNMIGFAPTDTDPAAEGMRNYDRQNYRAAIEKLSLAVRQHPDDQSLRLYLAISYLLDGQRSLAKPLLRDLVLTDNVATIPANWYLALVLLHEGNSAEARVLLQRLENDAVLGVKAKTVLEKIVIGQ